MGKTSLVLGFMIVILLVVSTGLVAATHTVGASGYDFTSIQAAINDAGTVNGDIIDVYGTITEAGIVVNKSLTIQGQGVSSTIVQAHATAGNATDRVFLITSGTVTLSNMAIQNGRVPSTEYGGGGIKIDGATSITFNNCDILNNQYVTYGRGGGIYSGDYSEPTYIEINGCTISNNTVNLEGGGICFDGSNISSVIKNSTINENEAGDYGGGIVYGSGNHELINSTIFANVLVDGQFTGGGG
ncbi:MAG: hypothetical protein U9P73_09155, partial [Candidatus Cloacimonadota bacterium]|nr:hypothetical protein [Candidatus Cloacimonadota bacterium]